jgi:hypothetical protein
VARFGVQQRGVVRFIVQQRRGRIGWTWSIVGRRRRRRRWWRGRGEGGDLLRLHDDA